MAYTELLLYEKKKAASRPLLSIIVTKAKLANCAVPRRMPGNNKNRAQNPRVMSAVALLVLRQWLT